LRDRVRLVRIPHRLHEQGQCPLGHLSLDATADGEPCLLDQLVEQLPAAQATALRLTVLEGLSLRAAAERLQISAMSVSHREVRLAAQRAQKKAIAALRQQLAGGG
jgi:DNA-directed RNA polymerase specialized sigma24 family protein